MYCTRTCTLWCAHPQRRELDCHAVREVVDGRLETAVHGESWRPLHRRQAADIHDAPTDAPHERHYHLHSEPSAL